MSEINNEKIESDARIEQLKIEIADLNSRYSCEVDLPEMVLQSASIIEAPTSMSSLLDLEDVISMIEVYMWIGNHHPESFTQINRCLEVR